MSNTETSGQPTQATTFTLADLQDLLAAERTLRNAERFFVDRFAAYTQSGEVRDEKGRSIPKVDDPYRTSSGYGRWRLRGGWVDRLSTIEESDLPSEPLIFEHFLADDRGPGGVTSVVKVPVSFIFGEDERQARYATYLALKAEFEA